jgi:biopolymer transport protein ExbD
MASIDIGTGRGDKKAVDTSIPLIPFIDLLLCCVMFLLVTAVWNELASHEAVQEVPGEKRPDDPPVEKLRLLLHVGAEGYVVSSTAGDSIRVPKIDGAYDEAALGERLRSYRDGLPDQHAITLVADDGVIYDDVMQAMDVATGQGFTGIAVSDT